MPPGDCGFAAVSANDHLIIQTAWLDGPATLAVEVTYTELNAASVDELPALRLGSGGDGGRV